MIILENHEISFRLTVPRCTGKAASSGSLRKSHDIVILSFCNIVKGQAKSQDPILHFASNISNMNLASFETNFDCCATERLSRPLSLQLLIWRRLIAS